MQAVFLKLLNMSISAGWLVLLLVLLRPLFKKAPKWISCLMWSLVALRLLVPTFVQSDWSLIPSAESVPSTIVTASTPTLTTGIPALNHAINPVLSHANSSTTQLILSIAVPAWLVGMVLMAAYYAISYLMIRRRTAASIPMGERVWLCDDISSPFILGVFRPRIYVPSNIEQSQLTYILAHENIHLARRDHLWKPAGFLLLSVYWYNPLIWIAYALLCRDIEISCDEKVISRMGAEDRKRYSIALATCGARHQSVLVCPVAFGEVGVKTRIKGVLSYKKPTFWIVIVACLIGVTTAVCFLTDPKPCAHLYTSQITTPATCTAEGVRTYHCEDCANSYTEPVAMLAHSYAQPQVAQAATCTQPGILHEICTGCAHLRQTAIDIVPHTLGEAFVSLEPNCSQAGMLSAHCTACQTLCPVEELPANDVHDLQETVIRTASCTTDGEGIHACTRCDYSESCTYQHYGHHYKVIVDQQPSCFMFGIERHICTNCGIYYMETINNTSHDFQYYNSTKVQCAKCGLITSNTPTDLFGRITLPDSTPFDDIVVRIFPP